mmetsp:Transcript_24472/g.20829  ORF Transcript_24472/g.20829 Transcript_24472/m.20829 type:complete len:232 (+) Transcript_24472:3-698(+)
MRLASPSVASEASSYQHLYPDIPPRASISHQCVRYAPIQELTVSEASAVFYSASLWNKSPELPAMVPTALILYSSTNPFSYEPSVVEFEQFLAGSFPDIRFYRVNLVRATQAELLQLDWITVPRVIVLAASPELEDKAIALSIDPPFDANRGVARIASVTGLRPATTSHFYRSKPLYSEDNNVKLRLDPSVFSFRDWTGLAVLAYTCISSLLLPLFKRLHQFVLNCVVKLY